MTPAKDVTVAVDAMGGDNAPDTVLEGVSAALAADPGLRVLLTGPADVVEPFAAPRDRVTAVVATEIIGMDEHPAGAVRAKKDSSIVVGCRLVKEGRAEAFFSAGNTGACMAASTLLIGRLPGVQRPAIATVLPGRDRQVVMLDAGANADCKPEHLVQFAHMGAAYARVVLGVTDPSVGLLSIGEEPSKGSALVQEAHPLLAASVPGFVGNVEGMDIPRGTTDVVVTDGFTGNVALKLMEGLAAVLLAEVKEAMTATPAAKLAAAVIRPSLGRLRDRLDPDSAGGAPLLGIAGVSIIGHGRSSARAVAAALAVAATAVRGDLPGRIAQSVGGAS
ncbi:MAG TPA: phosphate acyltransferase PlsX [Coriobacteriia bacterium]|jgi:glycerol-3-phosphate acyltransferase PlsX